MLNPELETQPRDGARAENLRGQEVMRRAVRRCPAAPSILLLSTKHPVQCSCSAQCTPTQVPTADAIEQSTHNNTECVSVYTILIHIP